MVRRIGEREKGVRKKWKERRETEGSEDRIGEGGREDEMTERRRHEKKGMKWMVMRKEGK